MAPESLRIVAVTDDAGQVVAAAELAAAESLHRQLRPSLPQDYGRRMQEVFANGGRLVLAMAAQRPIGLALWRQVENTYEGRRLYIDDLVTDEAHRSTGVGRSLLGWLEQRAQALGCDVLALDSGVQRSRAHAFYFREGFFIPSFCFRKTLK